MTAPLPSAAEARSVYGRLLAYARAWRGQFLIGVLGMALYAATEAGTAWFVDKFLKGVFADPDPDPRVVWAVPLGVLLLFLLRGVGDYISTYFPAKVGRHVVKAIRRDLFAQYLHLPASWYDRQPGGRALSRLVYDAEQVAEAATTSIGVVIRDSLALLGLLGFMFWKSWQFTLLALVVAPLIGWVLGGINRRFRRHSARIQQSMGDFTRVAQESLEGQRLIKTSTAEASQQRRFEAVNEQNRRNHQRLLRARAASNPVVQMVAAFGLAAVLAVALWRVVATGVAVNDFVSYLVAMMMVMAPLRRLVNVGGPLQQGIAAGMGIFAVLDLPREPAGGGQPLQRARGAVEYRGVGFAYEGGAEAVLQDIDFAVAPGQTLAIVGRSGAGKSTLVGLLPRLYDATSGSVQLDGADVRAYALADLRRQIAYVGQDVLLFDDTIRNNIALGMEEVAEARIVEAARAAHVLEFAASLPHGLDTPVGERGSQLSGGQRQRVAIARAILRDAPVLVLDEATSALDSESERHVQDALARLRAGRTTLVIAHRLSTVEQADRIIVLQDGRITEAGTHGELLTRGGVYSQLHQLQFNA
jgi:subfamily B ATP-binding cassette protein MsbA